MIKARRSSDRTAATRCWVRLSLPSAPAICAALGPTLLCWAWARPLDLPASEVAKRNDVLVIESGEIELPSKVVMKKSIGLSKNVIYACLAETIVLALEGRFEVFTIGRETEWEKVKEIYLKLKEGLD